MMMQAAQAKCQTTQGNLIDRCLASVEIRIALTLPTSEASMNVPHARSSMPQGSHEGIGCLHKHLRNLLNRRKILPCQRTGVASQAPAEKLSLQLRRTLALLHPSKLHMAETVEWHPPDRQHSRFTPYASIPSLANGAICIALQNEHQRRTEPQTLKKCYVLPAPPQLSLNYMGDKSGDKNYYTAPHTLLNTYAINESLDTETVNVHVDYVEMIGFLSCGSLKD